VPATSITVPIAWAPEPYATTSNFCPGKEAFTAADNPCKTEAEYWFPMLLSKYDNWVLYVANKQLELPGVRKDLPGGGAFEKYDDRLCLTEPGKNRGNWRLPGWMYPFPGKKPLTFHRTRRQWKKDGKWALLQVADRGQEFVLDCSEYPQQKVKEWVASLFNAAA
jgi:hypothetical protein